MATRIVRQSQGAAIAEHDLVRLLASVETDEGPVGAGEVGTVVHVYRGGEAFEVEFAPPFHVVTVLAPLVERVPV